MQKIHNKLWGPFDHIKAVWPRPASNSNRNEDGVAATTAATRNGMQQQHHRDNIFKLFFKFGSRNAVSVSVSPR